MNYTALDPILEKWSNEHGLVLHREWAGKPARFAYISSDCGNGADECYQVSVTIRPECIAVSAGSVEVWDREDVERSWETDLDGLAATLKAARLQILKWMRGKPVRTMPR